MFYINLQLLTICIKIWENRCLKSSAQLKVIKHDCNRPWVNKQMYILNFLLQESKHIFYQNCVFFLFLCTPYPCLGICQHNPCSAGYCYKKDVGRKLSVCLKMSWSLFSTCVLLTYWMSILKSSFLIIKCHKMNMIPTQYGL